MITVCILILRPKKHLLQNLFDRQLLLASKSIMIGSIPAIRIIIRIIWTSGEDQEKGKIMSPTALLPDI